MPIVYKIDVLSELKKKGYTPKRIRQERIMSESTLQKFRNNEMVSIDNIERLCCILNREVGNIIEYVPDED